MCSKCGVPDNAEISITLNSKDWHMISELLYAGAFPYSLKDHVKVLRKFAEAATNAGDEYLFQQEPIDDHILGSLSPRPRKKGGRKT